MGVHTPWIRVGLRVGLQVGLQVGLRLCGVPRHFHSALCVFVFPIPGLLLINSCELLLTFFIGRIAFSWVIP